MAEEDVKRETELGDFDDEDGFKYRHMRSGGSTSMFQKLFSTLKSPFTLMLSIVIVLLVVIVVLQVVQMSAACDTKLDQVISNQQSLETQQNDSMYINQINQATQSTVQRLSGIIHTLSNLERSDDTTKGAVDDILLVTEELLRLQNMTAIFSSHVPVSCQDIKKFDPSTPSGYYHINSQLVYCEMEELCGSSAGWTRIGYLDMSDSTVDCPDGFRQYEGQGIRGCGRPWGGASCVGLKIQPNGISYTEVCGKVIGYQKGSPDAVDTRYIDPTAHNDINSFYVDGVSITHGTPRQHIWTLMAGVFESYADDGDCPCNTPPGGEQSVQSFVGNDYFCESGNPTHSIKKSVFATDPLWDGKGCGQNELSCCQDSSGLPWFHKIVDKTNDFIELRECGDQQVGDEDVLINSFDIYVK